MSLIKCNNFTTLSENSKWRFCYKIPNPFTQFNLMNSSNIFHCEGTLRHTCASSTLANVGSNVQLHEIQCVPYNSGYAPDPRQNFHQFMLIIMEIIWRKSKYRCRFQMFHVFLANNILPPKPNNYISLSITFTK